MARIILIWYSLSGKEQAGAMKKLCTTEEMVAARGTSMLPAVSCCCGLQAGGQKLQGSIIIKTFLQVGSVSSFVFPCWSSFGLRLGIPNQEESCFTSMVQFTELLKSCVHLNILLKLFFIQQLLRVFLLPP